MDKEEGKCSRKIKYLKMQQEPYALYHIKL